MPKGNPESTPNRKRKGRRLGFVQCNRSAIAVPLASLADNGAALWLLLHLLDESGRPGADELLEVNLSHLARCRGFELRRLRRALSTLEDRGFCRRVGKGRAQRVEVLPAARAISEPEFEAPSAGDKLPAAGENGVENSDANGPDSRTQASGFPVELGRQRPRTRTRTSEFADIGTRARPETETSGETTRQGRRSAAARGFVYSIEGYREGLPRWQRQALESLRALPNLRRFSAGELYALAGLVEETRESCDELVAILRDFRPLEDDDGRAGFRALAFVRGCLLDRIERRVAEGIPEGAPLRPGQLRGLYVEAFDVHGNPLGTATQARRMDQRGVRKLVEALEARLGRASMRLQVGQWAQAERATKVTTAEAAAGLARFGLVGHAAPIPQPREGSSC